MIFLDTNVLVPIVLEHERSPVADDVLAYSDRIFAPILWRYEVAQVIGRAARNREVEVDVAIAAAQRLKGIVSTELPTLDAWVYLSTSVRLIISSYDAVWVYHASELGLQIATFDEKLTRAVPDVAISPEAYFARDTPTS